MKICFASNNKNKLKEIQSLLKEKIEFLTLDEVAYEKDIPETSKTIEGNALQKARYIFNKYNIACFADDTGLEVEALNGKPGVYSARYAGSKKDDIENIKLLLKNMKGKENRAARFKTVIAYVDKNQEKIFEGITNGIIASHPRGVNGFGYDSVFIPIDYVENNNSKSLDSNNLENIDEKNLDESFNISNINKTMAELTLMEKNRLSSRSIALGKFLKFLQNIKIDN